MKNLPQRFMGYKYQKKSNTCPFRGKEKIALESTIQAVKTHIPITTFGTFISDEIITTTVGMCLKHYSPTEICKTPGINFPSGTTYRNCIDTIDFDTLIKNNPALFSEYSHQILKKGKKYIFAVDEVTDPYYGEKIPENEDFIVGGKQKKSTNYFYSYITLYITIRNRRVTLAVFPVRKSETKVSYIKRFIDIIRSKGYLISVLLLDRGFWSAEVFQYLKNENIPHIMPVKAHGEKLKNLLDSYDIRQFTYPLCENSENEIDLDIMRFTGRKRSKKTGKMVDKNYGFVYYGIEWSLLKIRNAYKSRFSIESSYRMRNIVRPKTSTRKPAVRYFFAIVSFLLKNIWVVTLLENFRRKQRGPFVIISEWFRFDAFIDRMWNTILNSTLNQFHILNGSDITIK
ncbi:MAG: ISH3 family transposase [Methanobacteriota archaeon]